MSGIRRTSALTGLMLIGLGLCAASAQAGGDSGLKVIARIAGPDGGWDYASFDSARGRVYIAHGAQVMVIEAGSGAVIPRFADGDHLHAVVPVPGADRLVTTNSGDATARIISAADGRLIASLPTAADPDGAGYDPSTGFVLVMDGEGQEVTLVDPVGERVAGSIPMNGKLEFPAVDAKGRLFVNVEDKNEIAVVDIGARKVTRHYPLTGCQAPTGLAYVAGERLIAACSDGAVKILSARDGAEIASLATGRGPDAVIYDAGRALAYVPSGAQGELAVIALTGPANNTLIATVPTQKGARTGAVDSTSGRLYLPAADFLPPASPGARAKPKPGTFIVLVLGR